ncbi:hypothetical protein HK097_009344 [Rhizophlyctis rosea]|uniref:phosphatidate phosphatase n=1 Tax=Rhizophlyctis rosea TaxID=64517 RepID=A0AAD5SHV7_9FUNG|nr:hypothetical protein HK097_009344 [Rhizophlyctis rosea]
MTSVLGFAAGKVVTAVTAVSAFYTEINPATLSGAIDIIVVEQENGDLVSSPFHVRFGKLKVLRPHEKKVDVVVNGESTDLVMKVGEAGEAFFVVETENPVPSEYATSPIQQATSVDENIEPLELGEAADNLGEDNVAGYVSAHGSDIPEDDYPSDAASPSHLDLSSSDMLSPNQNGKLANGHKRIPSQHSAEPTSHDLPIDADDVAASYKHDAALMGIADGDDVEVFDTPHHTPVDAAKDVAEISFANVLDEAHRRASPSVRSLPPEFPAGKVEKTLTAPTQEVLAVNGVSEPNGNERIDHEPEVNEAASEPRATLDIAPHRQMEQEGDNGKHHEGLAAEDERPRALESSDNEAIVPTITETAEVSQPEQSLVGGELLSPGSSTALPDRLNNITPEGAYLASNAATAGEDSEDIAELTPVKNLVSPLPLMRPNARRADTLPLGHGKMKERKGVIGRASSVIVGEGECSHSRGVLRHQTPYLLHACIDGTASEDEYAHYDDSRAKVPAKSGPLSDNGVEYQDYTHKAKDDAPKGWSWVWGGLPTKRNDDEEDSKFEKRQPVDRRQPTTTGAMTVNEKVGSYLAGLPTSADGETYEGTNKPVAIGEHVTEGRGSGDRPGSPSQSDRAQKSTLDNSSGGLQGPDAPDALNVVLGEDTAIELSLCGYKSLRSLPLEAAEENFSHQQISYEMFCENPSIMNDPNLIIKINGHYFSWAVAGPILLSHVAFGKPLPENTMRRLLRQQILQGKANPDVSRKYSFTHLKSWWSRGSTVKPPTPGAQAENPNAEVEVREGSVAPRDSAASVDDRATTPAAPPSPPASPAPQDSKKADSVKDEGVEEKVMPKYAKSLRLTSEQLKFLKLKRGPNTITFSVKSGFQGTAICSAKMYLWGTDDKVVISDIDGTITKSDVFGHIFTMVGRDWTHSGIASLYTNIRKNGYHIMYLTSRAIGQASATRDYLDGIQQGGYQLPEGPIIMSPDRLLKSFHREVILRRPEEFKMACLRDIKRLFGDRSPFYAGFGNRITDALSYRSVDVPVSRIFSIDSTGEIKLELLATYKTSYIKLNDIVDQIFPPITDPITMPEYNDFNYWRPTFPEIELDLDFDDDEHSASQEPSDEDEDDDDEDEDGEEEEDEEMDEVGTGSESAEEGSSDEESGDGTQVIPITPSDEASSSSDEEEEESSHQNESSPSPSNSPTPSPSPSFSPTPPPSKKRKRKGGPKPVSKAKSTKSINTPMSKEVGGGDKKKCANCKTMSSPSWRKCPDTGETLCNACGLYRKTHHQPRPFKVIDGQIRVQRRNAAAPLSLKPASPAAIKPSATKKLKPTNTFTKSLSPSEEDAQGDDTETDVDSLPGAIGVDGVDDDDEGGGGEKEEERGGDKKTCRVKVFPPLGGKRKRGGCGGEVKGKGKR